MRHRPAGAGIILESTWSGEPTARSLPEPGGEVKSATNQSGFTALATGVKATAPTNTYTDTTATGKGQSFYRIVVE